MYFQNYFANTLMKLKSFTSHLQHSRLGCMSKDLPNMNTFCDWLSETIVISVYDSFIRRDDISIVLLSSIVLSRQSKRLFI